MFNVEVSGINAKAYYFPESNVIKLSIKKHASQKSLL